MKLGRQPVSLALGPARGIGVDVPHVYISGPVDCRSGNKRM